MTNERRCGQENNWQRVSVWTWLTVSPQSFKGRTRTHSWDQYPHEMNWLFGIRSSKYEFSQKITFKQFTVWKVLYVVNSNMLSVQHIYRLRTNNNYKACRAYHYAFVIKAIICCNGSEQRQKTPTASTNSFHVDEIYKRVGHIFYTACLHLFHIVAILISVDMLLCFKEFIWN